MRDPAAKWFVISRNRSAKHDARFEVYACEHLVQNNTADVVEEDVDPVRTKGRDPSTNILTFVVDRPIKTGHLD